LFKIDVQPLAKFTTIIIIVIHIIIIIIITIIFFICYGADKTRTKEACNMEHGGCLPLAGIPGS